MIPVHHENEIAQSVCATGHEFVRFWVHSEFLQVNGEKMSKSKNNFYTIEDIREKNIDPLAVRILFMQTSYRKPVNFTWESLDVAAGLLKKLQDFARRHTVAGNPDNSFLEAFKDALSDDLNTAKALAVVWELLGSNITEEDKWATLLIMDTVLGLDLANVAKFTISEEAKAIAIERDQARAEKNFTRSDELRAKLESLGYDVLDTPSGTELR